MKNFNIKTTIIYILIILYIIFTNIIGYRDFINTFNYIINPLFWIIIFTISIFINKEHIKKVKHKSIKLQTIFIIVVSYLIIYFLSGLSLGYTRNVYNTSFICIIKNIYTYVLPIILIEYTRATLINTNKNMVNYIFVTILFIFLGINNIEALLIKNQYSIIFKNISSIVLPSVASNILLTYLSITCNYYGNLFYKLPQSIATITLPILPNLNWYYTSIIGIILPLIIYIFIKNINDKIDKHNSIKRLRKESIIKLIYPIIPLLILICFVTGVFKYKPTAILSNSMRPIYSRGDVVVTKKLNEKELNNLAKYDIIEYILNGTIITHRIINIEEHSDGTKLYITKGDNNNAIDKKKVTENQIIGKVEFSIPKIGYPSVYLNEFFNKNRKAIVATGDK